MRGRIVYLDGLRGLAALYVVLHHAVTKVTDRSLVGSTWTGWLQYGHWSVDIFIVLSGYCLMLPVVRAQSLQLKGGVRGYLQRRARRILPPYFAALVISLLLVGVGQAFLWRWGRHEDWWRIATSPSVLMAHLLLIHNLNPTWSYAIDPPSWSVATEWQIYFVFPLLLLPVWRRYGNVATVLAGFFVGLLPHFAIRHGYNFDAAYPWYCGLFAMGMVSAAMSDTREPQFDVSAEGNPWGIMSCLPLLIVALMLLFKPRLLGYTYLVDALIGGATACLLVYCTRHLAAHDGPTRPAILSLLEARWAVCLGTFSYSLYLIHDPFLILADRFLMAWQVGPLAQLMILLGIMVPLCLALAYAFYWICERRFLSHASLPTQHVPVAVAA